MSVPNGNRLASLCDEFRSFLTLDQTGGGGLHQFVQAHDSLIQTDRSWLACLIEVDMQTAWSHWPERCEDFVKQAITPEALVDQWKELPRFQKYLGLFSGPEEASLYLKQLAGAESACRDQWGDAIGTKFYEHYFQVATEEVIRRERRHMRCEFEKNDDFSQVLFALRGCNEIGRQRTKDQEAYFCEINPDGNRLVVANRYEAEVSREQLSIQLLTPTIAIITNRSSVNSIRLSPDKTLSPGNRTIAQFPFTLQIPGRRLCCY